MRYHCCMCFYGWHALLALISLCCQRMSLCCQRLSLCCHCVSLLCQCSLGCRCESGCECPDTRLDGYQQAKTSLLMLHNVYATQHPNCVLSVIVHHETTTGEHKVKIAGVIVSEESGEQKGLTNSAAVEHVHDISFRHGWGNSSYFDIRNHVR